MRAAVEALATQFFERLAVDELLRDAWTGATAALVRAGLELRRTQRCLDLSGTRGHSTLATTVSQQAFERAQAQPSASGWRARSAKNGDSIDSVQVGARSEQRARIELAQSAAQPVGVPLSRPAESLMGTRQDLDGLRQSGIASHLATVVPIGTHQVGEDFGVACIRLRA